MAQPAFGAHQALMVQRQLQPAANRVGWIMFQLVQQKLQPTPAGNVALIAGP
jgi:hypothetical protein